jgi:2-haloacid dehalogenase
MPSSSTSTQAAAGIASSIKALTFDVFGTVVDWRGSIIREGEAFGRARGREVDWARFADAWRGRYQPSLEEVRSGRRPWTPLDDLHRESLEALLAEFGIPGLAPEDVEHLNRAWHRLDPWPDAVPGLTRLRRRYILATLSNGNVALMVNMARRAGLPWDAILGAEVAGHYKPQPEAYLRTAALLGLAPGECLMVAAHNSDLIAASGCGLRTAFVPRPEEHGPGQTRDLHPERPFDIVARDFLDLADQLDC